MSSSRVQILAFEASRIYIRRVLQLPPPPMNDENEGHVEITVGSHDANVQLERENEGCDRDIANATGARYWWRDRGQAGWTASDIKSLFSLDERAGSSKLLLASAEALVA